MSLRKLDIALWFATVFHDPFPSEASSRDGHPTFRNVSTPWPTAIADFVSELSPEKCSPNPRDAADLAGLVIENRLDHMRRNAMPGDAATGKELSAFNGHEGYVISVAFSPDSRA